MNFCCKADGADSWARKVFRGANPKSNFLSQMTVAAPSLFWWVSLLEMVQF